MGQHDHLDDRGAVAFCADEAGRRGMISMIYRVPRGPGGGGSRPFLVVADDGLQYWIKAPNNPQGPMVPVNEQIVGCLARAVGIAAPDRRRAALIIEARGEKPSESVEQIDLERRQAEVEVAGCRERREALRIVEQEVTEAVEAVEDAHPLHFKAKAEARAAALEERRASQLQEAAALVAEGRENAGEWSKYRNSCRRGGLPVPPEVLVSDLGDATSEFAKWSSYPAGSKAAWERWQEEQAARKAAQAGPRLSNREAVERFEAA